MGYKEDIVIDETDLVNELIKQPQLVVQYGDSFAERRAEKERLREMMTLVRAEAKQQLEQDRALIELVIRRARPEDYNVEKLTESVVQALINETDEFELARQKYSATIKEVIDNYADAVREHTSYKTAMEAFRDRRYGLEGMIKLFLTGHYGEVRVEDAGTANEQIKQTIAKGRKSLQTNRKISSRRKPNAKIKKK